jgi:nucleoside-diphosphate-sugar epimerase
MVTGTGLIAKRFSGYAADDRFLIFASGVSNSKTSDTSAFERESVLLHEQLAFHPMKKLVYFSTCSINDPVENSGSYVRHKLQMEEYIARNAANYTIFRISNLAGNTSNSNTVLNFFVNAIKAGRHFELWQNATRNIIDIDDAYLLMDHILQHDLYNRRIINIANPVSFAVPEIVQAIEKMLQAKASYTAVERGVPFSISLDEALPLANQLGIRFDDDYLSKLLRKYYRPDNDI